MISLVLHGLCCIVYIRVLLIDVSFSMALRRRQFANSFSQTWTRTVTLSSFLYRSKSSAIRYPISETSLIILMMERYIMEGPCSSKVKTVDTSTRRTSSTHTQCFLTWRSGLYTRDIGVNLHSLYVRQWNSLSGSSFAAVFQYTRKSESIIQS